MPILFHVALEEALQLYIQIEVWSISTKDSLSIAPVGRVQVVHDGCGNWEVPVDEVTHLYLSINFDSDLIPGPRGIDCDPVQLHT